MDICTSVLVSVDYGLSMHTVVRGHAISGLPHEPATIFHGYIVRILFLFIQYQSLFLCPSLFTSLVRNPISIEERFRMRALRLAHEKDRVSFFLLFRGFVSSILYWLKHSLTREREREREREEREIGSANFVHSWTD